MSQNVHRFVIWSLILELNNIFGQFARRRHCLGNIVRGDFVRGQQCFGATLSGDRGWPCHITTQGELVNGQLCRGRLCYLKPRASQLGDNFAGGNFGLQGRLSRGAFVGGDYTALYFSYTSCECECNRIRMLTSHFCNK